MSPTEHSTPHLERLSQQATDFFLILPTEPGLQLVEEQLITSASTPYDAAERILADLTADEKANLLIELANSDEPYDFEPNLTFNGDETTYRQVMDRLLVDIVANKMFEQPEVAEQSRKNLTRHDEWRDEFDGQK